MSGGAVRRRWLLFGFALLLASGVEARQALEDEVLVLLRPGSDAAALAKDFNLRPLTQRPIAALDVESVVFALNGAPDRAALLARLAADARVESAQAVHLHHVAGMPPKDPYFDLQVRTRPGGVSTLATRASGRNVRIAVIDTGMDSDHPDLLGQVAEARNFVGADSHVIPAEFHGTAVTGLIVAHAGNGVGIHGLAPKASVHLLRACWEPSYGDGICSSYTLAQALDYAIEIRARIINLSLAGPDDPLLARLVERAAELGAIVFGAIGEEPEQTFPTSVPAVIAVEQARQSGVEVPGERLTVPGLQLLTTVPGGRYDFVSGPSFATAHASGVAAIMLELEPRLGPHELAAWLRRLHENPEPR